MCRCEGGASKRVVILGGTGRVGSATAASLLANFSQYELTVASRSRESFEKIVELRPGLKNASFARCDISSKADVKVLLQLQRAPLRAVCAAHRGALGLTRRIELTHRLPARSAGGHRGRRPGAAHRRPLPAQQQLQRHRGCAGDAHALHRRV